MIRHQHGIARLDLFVDSRRRDSARSMSESTQWVDTSVFWAGRVDAGSHSVWLQSPTANAWGCASEWGDLDVLVLPARPVERRDDVVVVDALTYNEQTDAQVRQSAQWSIRDAAGVVVASGSAPYRKTLCHCGHRGGDECLSCALQPTSVYLCRL